MVARPSELIVDPDEPALATQIYQLWNSGAQPSALELLRPRADAGRPWAAALLAWLLMQQGVPGIGESVTWAVKAAQLGAPGQVVHTFNNAVANIANDSSLADRLSELLEWGMPWMGNVDLVGQGWNLVGQGQPETGIRLMMTPIPLDLPITQPQWRSYIAQAKKSTSELNRFEDNARQIHEDVDSVARSVIADIQKARDDLETNAAQAGLLVNSISADATGALYDAAGDRNAAEARGSWRAGLVVLGAAAAIALLPVALHYLGSGPTYSAVEQIVLHLTSTVALGSFAGVLLARGRARDRAAQRAYDLSTAMGSMISYSNQIVDPVEKQSFIATMGQAILNANLATGSKRGSKEDATSASDLIALANLLKPTMASASQSAAP